MIAQGLRLGVVVIALLALVVMSSQAAREYRSLDWPTTEGVVVTSAVHAGGRISAPTYMARVGYRYEVDGVAYSSDRISGDSGLTDDRTEAEALVVDRPVGATVTVHYDPETPSEALLVVSPPRGLLVAILVALGLALLFGREMVRSHRQIRETERRYGPSDPLRSGLTDQEFEALVARLERSAAAAPRSYRLLVVAFGMFGYAYVGVVLLTVVAAAIWIGWAALEGRGRVDRIVPVLFALGALVVLIGRALRVRIDPPAEPAVTASELPTLFRAIEEVGRAVGAPPLYSVHLCGDFNASVQQRPRFGVLGGTRNHLRIGLPLLQSLSKDQFLAVLAHEFGHLSGAHGKIGAWVYRVRRSWSVIANELARQEHWGSFLFLPFFRWYAPTYAAWSFVLARRQEVEADEHAARVGGARSAADALIVVSTAGAEFGSPFWGSVWSRTAETPRPEPGPFATWRAAALRPADPEDERRRLDEALALETESTDTHPGLQDRLAELGEEPRVPPPLETSAADALLADAHDTIVARFDDSWWAEVHATWTERYEKTKAERERLEELEDLATEGPLEADQSLDRARLTEHHRTVDAARALTEEHVLRWPDDLPARFLLGRLRLAAGDETGLEDLELVMARDEAAVIDGCNVAALFLMQQGRSEEAAAYRARLAKQGEREAEVAAERNRLPFDGTYVTVPPEEGRIAEIVAALRASGAVRRAWLVRRAGAPGGPLFALGVDRRTNLLRRLVDHLLDKTKPRDLALQEQLARTVPTPGETHFLVLNHRSSRERLILTRVGGSRIL